jgi:hypothetical protein
MGADFILGGRHTVCGQPFIWLGSENKAFEKLWKS